jgi:hypothetical protein
MCKWQNLLQFTISVRKSHRQPQCTLQLVCEDRVFFEWADLHVYVGSSVQNASEQFVSCTQLSSVNLALHSDKQNKNLGELVCRFKQLYLCKHSELDTCSYKRSFHNDP